MVAGLLFFIFTSSGSSRLLCFRVFFIHVFFMLMSSLSSCLLAGYFACWLSHILVSFLAFSFPHLLVFSSSRLLTPPPPTEPEEPTESKHSKLPKQPSSIRPNLARSSSTQTYSKPTESTIRNRLCILEHRENDSRQRYPPPSAAQLATAAQLRTAPRTYQTKPFPMHMAPHRHAVFFFSFLKWDLPHLPTVRMYSFTHRACSACRARRARHAYHARKGTWKGKTPSKKLLSCEPLLLTREDCLIEGLVRVKR